jgi:hypothetical protein
MIQIWINDQFAETVSQEELGSEIIRLMDLNPSAWICVINTDQDPGSLTDYPQFVHRLKPVSDLDTISPIN